MSVMWNRIYGKEKFANLYDRYFACQQLKMTLELTGCKRLVIGHTPQVILRTHTSVWWRISTVGDAGLDISVRACSDYLTVLSGEHR